MTHLPPVGWADVATKDDLHQLEARLDAKIDGVESRLTVAIANLSAEMHSTLRTNTYLTVGAVAAVGGLISATVSLA